MNPPRSRPAGWVAPSRLAAQLYMQGGITLAQAGAKFGVSGKTVSYQVFQIRREQLSSTPEDEVTC